MYHLFDTRKYFRQVFHLPFPKFESDVAQMACSSANDCEPVT